MLSKKLRDRYEEIKRTARMADVRAKFVWEQMQDTLEYLHDRWLDECEYEDFEGYAEAAAKRLAEVGEEKFVRLTKHPFTLVYDVQGRRYEATVTSRAYKFNSRGEVSK